MNIPCSTGHHSILIHGAAGTGKSTVLQRLSDAAWGKVLSINDSIISVATSKTEANLNKLFHEAISAQPSLIIIDDLDAIAAKAESGTARALSQNIRKVREQQIQIVATATRPIDVHEKVARCFLVSIELPIPNAVTTIRDASEIRRSYPSRDTEKGWLRRHTASSQRICANSVSLHVKHL